jgi:hypothetical protein
MGHVWERGIQATDGLRQFEKWRVAVKRTFKEQDRRVRTECIWQGTAPSSGLPCVAHP